MKPETSRRRSAILTKNQLINSSKMLARRAVLTLRTAGFRARCLSGGVTTLSNGETLSGAVRFEPNAEKGTAIVTLNRPKALNALNKHVVHDLRKIFHAVSYDSDVRAVVLTGGSEKFFAAGADIKEMLDMDHAAMRDHDRGESLLELMHLKCSKPVIAAVNGFAFGGGCELAMLCDIIIAGENAKFGQPEVSLGIMAGAGGTQRLTKAVGKSLSMQMNLTGEPIGAERAMIVRLFRRPNLPTVNTYIHTCEPLLKSNF